MNEYLYVYRTGRNIVSSDLGHSGKKIAGDLVEGAAREAASGHFALLGAQARARLVCLESQGHGGPGR